MDRKPTTGVDSSAMGALLSDRIRGSKDVELPVGGSRTLRRCEPCRGVQVGQLYCDGIGARL